MRYLMWAIKLLLFCILFVFAMHNADPVRLRFFLGYYWDAPLALLLLLTLAIGAVCGILAGLGQSIRLRRELLALRKDKKVRGEQTISSVPHVDAEVLHRETA